MKRLAQIVAERQEEMDQREAELLLNWRIQLTAAALPRAMQEVSGMNPSKSAPAAAKIALQHADEVLKLILEEAAED